MTKTQLKRGITTALAAFAVASSCSMTSARTVPSFEVVAQYHPDGYGGMPHSAMSGGIMDDDSPINWAGARMDRTYHLAGKMLHIQELEEKAGTEAYRGMLDGTYSPVVRYTDGTTDVAALLAKKIARAGYHKMSQDDAQQFLNQRQADYEHAVTAQKLPSRSLTSACGYWVESLYNVGGNVQASALEMDQIRATCALTIGKTEKIGSLTTNEQRYAVGRTLAMIGGTLRTLATQPADRSDAIAGARAMFKSNFGYAIDAVPVSRFPCVLSDNKMNDCDIIMSRYAAKLPEIAHRNT